MSRVWRKLAVMAGVVVVQICLTAPAYGWLDNATQTNATFERVRKNPLELRAFLEGMPKGADLHLHLAGAVYAESFIAEAAADDLCVDRSTMTLTHDCGAKTVDVKSAFRDQSLYTALVDAFSMRSFVPSAGVSAHDQFFATFGRFQAIDARKHLGEWLDEVAWRAGVQNEQYLEIMHTPDFALAAKLGREVGWNGDLARTREALLARGLRKNVDSDRKELNDGESKWREVAHCGASNESAGCQVKVRYLFQVLRGFPPEQVFAQTLLGFELASVDPRVVGINFVMPEDWYVPMRDYHLQMQMLQYLHGVYPQVHISLHAGELAPGMVPPSGLEFHIREAVEIGHAERIGHGADVMYERDARDLLWRMAHDHVAVEINLTSNDVILGVRGRQHPLPVYRTAGVPVVLSTDDEGVSRIDLTHEYVRASEEFGFGYRDLKNIVKASIDYSFLGANEKAEEERKLASRFQEFERKVASAGR